MGAVLRLQRAGVLELVQRGKRRGVAALVPKVHRSGSWQRAIDSQGNQFRVSPSGLIVADGEPCAGREPASVANVAYYLAQAYALMATRYRRQGLLMAAEVLDLPRADRHVKMAQHSICRLFKKLGITGNVRAKLYRNLVGVAHRVKAGAHLMNHIHGFAIVVPLAWQVMANSSPKLGKNATVMAFAFGAQGTTGRPAGELANLLWITRKLPRQTPLSVYARTRLSTTAGSRIRASSWKPPTSLGQAVAYEVDPVKYRGRRLKSLQLFFIQKDRVHHLNLLTSPKAGPKAPRRALERVLGSFRPKPPPNPCNAPR